MKFIDQSYEILDWNIDEKKIERAGKTCYKSEDSITEDSAARFCRGLIKRQHLSVLEHGSATVKLITDRGVLAELTRHRLASYSVESTRYVDYSSGLVFIRPQEFRKYLAEDGHLERISVSDDVSVINSVSAFFEACQASETAYTTILLNNGNKDLARQVLPMSLKTEIVVTANAREWRHIFQLRVQGMTGKPHSMIRELLNPVQEEFMRRAPNIFFL